MSGSMSSPKDEDEERQPLLSPKQVTPLPKLQLLAVCGMRFTCPVHSYRLVYGGVIVMKPTDAVLCDIRLYQSESVSSL